MYRLEVQGIQRAEGRSAVAAAAYRAGVALHDERLEMRFDYSARGGVEHAEILAPDDAPAALRERQALWNAAEAADVRADSRPARDILLALPHELDTGQRLELVRDFLRQEVVARGMVADFAMHGPDRHGDQRNHHAHILVTTRELTPDGFGRKVEAWTKPQLVREWRTGWAQAQNRHLQRALGREAPQVSEKSLAERGVERAPTIHLGPAASAMERRGERSDRGDVNRAIYAEAEERRSLHRSIRTTEDALVSASPKGVRGTQAIIDELGALHGDLVREQAALEREREAITAPKSPAPSQIAREALEPLQEARRLACARLARTEARVASGRQRRGGLQRWIANPARMIWAKHAELNALRKAREAVRTAETRLRDRRKWLASPVGQDFVARRIQPIELAAKAAHTQRRTLERRIRRIGKRVEEIEAVRLKAMIAKELGHASLAGPSRTLGSTQFVRALDAAAIGAMRQHSSEAQRKAYQRVKLQQRERVRGFSPPR